MAETYPLNLIRLTSAEGRKKTVRIGFLLFDNLTQLDLMGPLQVLSRLPDCEAITIADHIRPIKTDCPVDFIPSHDFQTAGALDMVCVPGGFGIAQALADDRFMDFLRKSGEGADYITSVCTGALLLGGAGFLSNKRATTHWAYAEVLKDCGAIYQQARIVRDGNIFTGGGVTAGIDFAFTLAKEICGADIAEAIQLGLEYDPSPPMNAGTPDKAKPEILAALQTRYESPVAQTRDALRQRLERA